jgi:energy-coupling factor transporter transmembrane protein EcfT
LETVVSFLTERWYLVLAALVVVFLVFKLIKALLKWIVVLAVVAALVFYGTQYYAPRGGRRDGGRGAETAAVAAIQDRALEALRREAEYELHKDGSFTLRTKAVQVNGKPGDKKAQVRFMNRTFSIELDRDWNQLLEEARKRL